MIYYLPFLLALIVGYAIFVLIYRKNPCSYNPIEWTTTFWLGIGACSVLSFLGHILFNSYDPQRLVALSLITILSLLTWGYISLKKPSDGFQENRPVTIKGWLTVLLLGILVWFIIQGFVSYNPYGNWDAWSFWNFRSRYLANAGSHWMDIYTHLAQAKHPWFLAYWTLFGWSFTGGESIWFTIVSAQIFTMVLMFTVFFGIQQLSKKASLAFIGTLWLISMPFFITHCVSQYADVIVAGLFCLAILLALSLPQNPTHAITLGLILGILSFVKDEGIIASLILICLVRPWSWRLVVSFVIALIPTVCVKYWMIPAPAGENSVILSQIFDFNRIIQIISYFAKKSVDMTHGGIVFIPVFLLIFWAMSLKDQASHLIGRFLTIFIVVFFMLYMMVSGDLSWRLEATSSRFLYQILPLSIMMLFQSFSLIRKP